MTRQQSGPQNEDGYVRLANELYEAVMRFPFSIRQIKVLMAIIRKTYGWQKKKDDLVASQIAELTGVHRPHVSATLVELERMNVIHRSKGQFGPKSIVEVNKHYRMWSAVPTSAGKVDFEPGEVPIQYAEPDSAESLPQIEGINVSPCEDDVSGESEYQNGTPHQVYQNGTDRGTETVHIDVPNRYTQKTTNKRQLQKTKTFPHSLRERFDFFWSEYPKKVEKKKALAAFMRIAPDDDLLEKIMRGLKAAKQTEQWQDKGLIKYAAAWLKDERWEDEHRIEYSAAQIALMDSYNESLSAICGPVSCEVFSESRAYAMDAFLAFTTKESDPERWSRWFPWVASNVDVPPRAGFDYLISREGFAKIKAGQFQKVKT